MTAEHRERLPLVYPFRWEGLEPFAYPRDADGLPLVDLGAKYGRRHNPITVAQYGLFCLQRHVETREAQYLECMFRCVRWLVQNARPWREDVTAWVYDYGLDFYGPQAPWISGMAQGQAISLLLRAHALDADARFLEISRGAFQAFLRPISEGGVVSHFPDGSVVFEEYPTEPPPHVLNGHLFALFGIHDYTQFWNDPVARELLDLALDGLRKNLHRYDTGYWNLYDLHPTRRLASPMYIKVHVQQLRILAAHHGVSDFAHMAGRWNRYLISPRSRLLWLVSKLWEKIRLKIR